MVWGGSKVGKDGSKTKEEAGNNVGCDGVGLDVMQARMNGCDESEVLARFHKSLM